MTKETRYGYERRIKELEREVESLRPYRRWAIIVFEAALDKMQEGTHLSWPWAIKQLRDGCLR